MVKGHLTGCSLVYIGTVVLLFLTGPCVIMCVCVRVGHNGRLLLGPSDVQC